MTIATEALGTAGMGCDACTEGDFAKASREFKRASGIFNYLATEKIPQWTENGCVQVDGLPAEASIGVCEAFHTYFLAIAQQVRLIIQRFYSCFTIYHNYLSHIGPTPSDVSN